MAISANCLRTTGMHCKHLCAGGPARITSSIQHRKHSRDAFSSAAGWASGNVDVLFGSVVQPHSAVIVLPLPPFDEIKGLVWSLVLIHRPWYLNHVTDWNCESFMARVLAPLGQLLADSNRGDATRSSS